MERLTSVETCVDRVLETLGRHIRVALPLALGKPNHFVNALYARARRDPDIQLEIYMALTLERPKGQTDLERRFLDPLVARLFGNYPDLDYELDRVREQLPENVRVYEFYFPAGKFLGNPRAQRDYISTNYTYVARDLMDRKVNLLAQQVAVGVDEQGRERLSLSSNPDVTVDLMAMFRAHVDPAVPRLTIAQRNDELPFMHGEADLDPACFDYLIDAPEMSYTLFGPPKTSVSDVDHMIGLYASTLVRDGGELQIGIGSLGDALVYSLLLRHEANARYQNALDELGVLDRSGTVVQRRGETRPFEAGLFVASEMLVDGFMHLIDAGIIKRRVYDDIPLQRLLNEERIDEHVSLAMLDRLRERRAISPVLTAEDVRYLKRFGILDVTVEFEAGEVVLPDGGRFVADLDSDKARARLERGLGERLKGGVVMQGAFFLGSPRFYEWLRELTPEKRRLIHMRSVQRVNQLYGHEALDRLHRRNARFFNTGMMVTLLGAVVSDALEDGRVVSGVGGQYNFVAMAHALPDGHSVLQVRSTRSQAGKTVSNVVWNYGHTTIPRHQRDLLITEYGIADLRGKSDAEVVAELIKVADSRFQPGLLADAKRAGKLDDAYRIPDRYCHNLPESYAGKLDAYRKEGLFPRYPFGTELTEEEITLAAALRRIKAKVESTPGALEAILEAAIEGTLDEDVAPYLKRMDLQHPETLRERLYQRLIAAELHHVLREQATGSP